MEKLLNNFTDPKLLTDSLIFSIGPLTSIVAARLGRHAWIKYEIAISAICALILAFKPDLLMSIMLKSSLKPFHLFLCAWYGCYLLATVLVPLFVHKSQDESIFYGHYYARIIEHSLIAIDTIIAYQDGVHWNYKYLCLVTSMALTHLLINIYFLAKTPKPSGQNPFKDLANSIGKIDFYLAFVYGAYIYAFPDRVNFGLAGAATANESYRSLTRACGALMLGASMQSFCMSEFKFIRDKKNFLLSRLVGSILELAIIFSGFYCFQIYSLETFGGLAIFSVVYKLIILYGYINTPHEHLKAH